MWKKEIQINSKIMPVRLTCPPRDGQKSGKISVTLRMSDIAVEITKGASKCEF
jgi:hypothetical protein